MSILARLKPKLNLETRVISVCQKDSQDIRDEDRYELGWWLKLKQNHKIIRANKCSRLKLLKVIEQEEDGAKVLVTHGTDTLIETAKFVSDHMETGFKGRVVVFTGSFLPAPVVGTFDSG